jgi:uncharacterized protein YaiE (UPF0345 family)
LPAFPEIAKLGGLLTTGRNSREFRPSHTISQIEEPAMPEFANVTVVKKANIYFDGKVTSRTVIFPDGTKKTLGIMLPGEYTFNTGAKELMEIQGGLLELLVAGETTWRTIKGGQDFEVPANSSFTMRVKEVSDYICSFLP